MRVELSFKELERKNDAPSNAWRLWELKNANMHRGIIIYEPSHDLAFQQIEALVRELVVNRYKPTWIRGFGFGVVIQFNIAPNFELRDFINCIDSYNKNKGVFQWVVAVDHENKKIFAAHMWLHGALHGAFIDALDQVTIHQYSIEKVYKEKPNFFINLEKSATSLFEAATTLRILQVVIGVVFSLYLIFKFIFKI